jgi:hypothetical protein
MVLVNLEDLWGETAPQNVPGTNLERPNWQRKARYSLEDFTQSTRVAAILQAIATLRGRSLPKSLSKSLPKSPAKPGKSAPARSLKRPSARK